MLYIYKYINYNPKHYMLTNRMRWTWNYSFILIIFYNNPRSTRAAIPTI